MRNHDCCRVKNEPFKDIGSSYNTYIINTEQPGPKPVTKAVESKISRNNTIQQDTLNT